jgi:hypothetical protein
MKTPFQHLSLAALAVIGAFLVKPANAAVPPTAPVYLWIDDAEGNLGKVNIATGEVTMIGDMHKTMTDIAFDSSGKLYGVDGNALYQIDTTNAHVNRVGTVSLGDTHINSLVFASDGTLYAASNYLYTINTSTGATHFLGGGTGYLSSGDLAFINGNLYLSSRGSSDAPDNLVKIDTLNGHGSFVGSIGVPYVYGMATNNNVDLYGVAGTSIYSINTETGLGKKLVSYSGHGLYAANGTAFITEAVPAIPEPTTTALLLAGAVALLGKRKLAMSES